MLRTKLCVCVGKYCMLSLCVKLLYVKFVCVKLLYVKDKVACVREAAGGGGGRRRHPGYRIKNKNPTQSCGEKGKSSTVTKAYLMYMSTTFYNHLEARSVLSP